MSGADAIEARFAGRFGDFLLDAAFVAPARGVTALFGPSGCGKTTVLRCIAGLQPSRGLFRIGPDVWQDGSRARPAHRRPVGYVFQEASLFPHLSVRDNLAFGLHRAARLGTRAGIGFDEAVSLLGLGHLLPRAPLALSGGERQRVAIGRALLSRPSLLLMDEPLSALDRRAKDDILPFLERLHESLALPLLYVTHDMGEVERMADHLVLMEAGRVIACGPLETLQSDLTLPLVRSREAAVTIPAVTTGHDARYGLLTLAVAGGSFSIPSPPVATGQRRRLRVAAGDVSLALAAPRQTSISNVLPCRIESLTETGPAEVMAVLRLGDAPDGARLLSRLTRRSRDQLGLAVGSPVYAQVKGVALMAGPTGAA